MKNQLKIIALLFCSSLIYAQSKSIQGKVLDSLKNPIQYANVGILNKPIGTVTDKNGEFNFSIENALESDTLKISCLGYDTQEIIIKNLSISFKEKVIVLKNYFEKLDEIVVSKNNMKDYSEGKEKTDTKHQVIFANPNFENFNLGTEIGRKFSLGNKTPSFLTNFKFFIKDNNFEMVKFRVNIYSLKNNRPNKKINQTNIVVQVDKKLTDWVNVDLTSFDIKVQQDVVITVEWIEHSNDGNKLNLPMIIPSFGSIHYYKFGSQANWEKYGKISSSMMLYYKQ
ncbi:carboxypeptidase-like regulatory domain-containing protein [Flavobacterium sp. LC2016-12]|uniref:carboxypeptidase-like regulatory domain-containing protein n=1 Tax=Flavobacterium sp. LC2016-12 TaxID=2783794 RepID=UPI00188CD5D9|nr:carboxypeptidase-like regulatory domain-containing protein [Flavobacterium sp. LC2016-12]MBF4466834.1 carboxypeptidase-like regulatory domain-containing protein [Flavobacterium sp. LC2016-12]